MKIAKVKNCDCIADFGATTEDMDHYDAAVHDLVDITPDWPTDLSAFRAAEYADQKAWVWDSVANRFMPPPRPRGILTRTEMLAISNPTVNDRVYCSDYHREFWWTGNTWQCDCTVEGLNNSGASVDEGDCMVPSGSLANGYSTTTTQYHPSVVGTVVIGGSQGDYVTIAVSGGPWKQWVYSTLTVGEHLCSYVTNGVAYGVGGPPASVSGQFATSKQSKGSGTGLALVQLGILAHY